MLIVHMGAHALTSANAKEQQSFNRNFLKKQKPGTPEWGIANHAFQDSIFHSINGRTMEEPGSGHLECNFNLGTRADSIYARQLDYRKNSFDLFEIMKGQNAGRTQILSDDAVRSILHSISTPIDGVDYRDEGQDLYQITILKAVISTFGVNEKELASVDNNDPVDFQSWIKFNPGAKSDGISEMRVMKLFEKMSIEGPAPDETRISNESISIPPLDSQDWLKIFYH